MEAGNTGRASSQCFTHLATIVFVNDVVCANPIVDFDEVGHHF